MTIQKITNFYFPVGHKVLSQDAYYRALSEASSGFYPVGEKGIWHGGIHIDDGVLKSVDGGDNAISCIANGEVIAYRVNDVYPNVTYDPNSADFPILKAMLDYICYFSTGFTLVRHYFEMPSLLNDKVKPPSITLYSLYMHQLDWYGYTEMIEKKEYPTFWHLVYGEVSNDASDIIKGTVIRKNGAKTTELGLLLKDSQIKVGDQIDKTNWYQLTEIVSGGFFDVSGTFHRDLKSISGYVFGPEIGITSRVKHDPKNIYTITKENNNKLDNGVSVTGIAVHDDTDKRKIITYLSKKAIFELDGQENGYAKIVKIKGAYVPNSLIEANGTSTKPHKGWVNISNLTKMESKPKSLDSIVVLEKPIPIKGGDFIGYLGHNTSRDNKNLHAKNISIATIKRPANSILPVQGHFELFTGDDLPAFIEKTRSLAGELPASEKRLILVDKGAQLIQEKNSDDTLLFKQHVSVVNYNRQSYYQQVNVEYYLVLNGKYFDRKNVIKPEGTVIEGYSRYQYKLTQENKAELIKEYQFIYSKLTLADIPDKVELTTYNDEKASQTTDNLAHGDVGIFFTRVTNPLCWVKTSDISHIYDKGDIHFQSIPCWTTFPLSLTSLPKPDSDNTVNFPRTISLSSLETEYKIAIDDENYYWAYISAINENYVPIEGWVNTSQNKKGHLQPHISTASAWEWVGFSTVEETAKQADSVKKLQLNRKVALDLADYTEAMSALNRVLTKTQPNEALPPFNDQQLKTGLREPWIAEQIGRLAIKYESEWYADESLSKWNELDDFYKKEFDELCEAKKNELTAKGIREQSKQKHTLDFMESEYNQRINEWQKEKQQRIKPSLWWSELVTLQSAHKATAGHPVLSQLPVDGNIWHVHPVGMMAFNKSIPTKVCPIDPKYRSHFVLHCTAGNMSEQAILNGVYKNGHKLQSKAHKYIMPDGKVIEIWPFTKRDVWATKAESRNNLKGRMVHVEINYGRPSVPSEAQYQTLAQLYIEASIIEGYWLIIVPHLEIDRGIADGHSDPTDFDYNKFYDILRNNSVPIDIIPHFEHERYWEDEKCKINYLIYKNVWPPILSGNPYRKK